MKRAVRKSLAILLALCAITVAAQDKPKVAVYVTDGGDKSLAAKILAGAGAHGVVAEALVKGINVTGAGEATNLTKEITKEFGASVGAAQAAAVGQKFGVQGLCVVTISGIKGKSFSLSVSLVDVATGQETAKGGPAQVDFGNPPGILTAMGNIAKGLVVGLAKSAVVKAVAAPAAQAVQALPAPPELAAQAVQALPTPPELAAQAVQALPTPPGQAASAAQPASTRQPPALPPAPAPARVPRRPGPLEALPVNERPWVAVYARGRAKDEEVKAAFGPELLFALAKSGRYRAVEANTEFAANVAREAEKLGAPGANGLTDRQIALIAGGSHADFVCVVDVATVLGSYQVFARVINVKTLDAAEMGKTIGKISDAADISAVADKVVESMFGVSGAAAPQIQEMQEQVQEVREWVGSVEKQALQARQIEERVSQAERQVEDVRRSVDAVQRQVDMAHPRIAPRARAQGPDNRPRYLKKGVSIGGGIGMLISNSEYSYSGSGASLRDSSGNYGDNVGVGAHFNVDLIYVQLFSGASTLPYSEGGLLLKIPVGNDYFKWYPMVGLCVYSGRGGGFAAGSRIEIGMGQVTYLTSEYLYSGIGNYGAYTLKSGIGWDIGFGEGNRGFFRPEFRYGWIVTSHSYNNNRGGSSSSSYNVSRHIWEFRFGLGYKWDSKGKGGYE